MKDWLAYSGAFGCAVAAATLCYMAAFSVLMGGAGYGISGLILLAVICPAMAGYVTFGLTYFAFTRQSFGLQGWTSGFALLVAATTLCFGLIMAGILPEAFAALAWVGLLFVGGRMLIARANHV